MAKFRSMTYYPLLRDPWYDRVYFEDMFKSCCQIEINTDGTVDVYDFNTGKHLTHFKK